MSSPATTILFGAFDRHNLGDLLFPHVVSALLPGHDLHYAGLINRDLRAYGGHQLRSIAELARELHGSVNLIHVGGELLTCAAADAQAMLGAGASTSIFDPAPYVAAKARFRHPTWFACNAVGGADFDRSSPALREAVLARLRDMDSISVRDRQTQAALARHGIAAALVPDPGVMTAALFAERIAQHRASGEVAHIAGMFPNGHIAVQFSADFADDASLNSLAAQCDRLATATGLAIILFRAGAAPLHDSMDLYRALRQRMRESARAALFESLNIWDICALIAASRGYLGSSLHGRMLALAYALPRVTLVLPHQAQPGKHRAFIEAWEDPAMPGAVPPDQGAAALLAAMDTDPTRSRHQAERLVALYRAGCESWRSKIPPHA
jgi:polysaccharide pyruvyl transferase WcaK-like protein